MVSNISVSLYYFSNRSILPIGRTQTDITFPNQNELENNGNEMVIPQLLER